MTCDKLRLTVEISGVSMEKALQRVFEYEGHQVRKSAQALNRDLVKRRIQFKQNGTWVLYSDYADRGYTEIKQEVLDSGRVIYHRRWTQLGRVFLLRLYGVDKEGQTE